MVGDRRATGYAGWPPAEAREAHEAIPVAWVETNLPDMTVARLEVFGHEDDRDPSFQLFHSRSGRALRRLRTFEAEEGEPICFGQIAVDLAATSDFLNFARVP